jgi:hypothetical protein
VGCNSYEVKCYRYKVQCFGMVTSWPQGQNEVDDIVTLKLQGQNCWMVTI